MTSPQDKNKNLEVCYDKRGKALVSLKDYKRLLKVAKTLRECARHSVVCEYANTLKGDCDCGLYEALTAFEALSLEEKDK